MSCWSDWMFWSITSLSLWSSCSKLLSKFLKNWSQSIPVEVLVTEIKSICFSISVSNSYLWLLICSIKLFWDCWINCYWFLWNCYCKVFCFSMNYFWRSLFCSSIESNWLCCWIFKFSCYLTKSNNLLFYSL